jgi:hypothetical protein
MATQFISEPIKPVIETYDTRNMSIGAPGLPKEFIWHGQKVMVTETLRSWRTTGACCHGSGEQYARKHWFFLNVLGAYILIELFIHKIV